MLTNADVTSETKLPLHAIKKEINFYLKIEKQIYLEKGELSNTSYGDFSFPDVIFLVLEIVLAAGSHTRKIDLDIEVIEDPYNKYFCPRYANKTFQTTF